MGADHDQVNRQDAANWIINALSCPSGKSVAIDPSSNDTVASGACPLI
jgi:hypothetical protein